MFLRKNLESQPPTPTTSTLLSEFLCDFDTENNICGIEQADDDQFNWRRRKGPTPSRGTGPSVDNTKVRTLI